MAEKRIRITRPSEDEVRRIGVRQWDTWGCEASTFPWEYGEKETCFILEGRVRVEGRDEDADVEPVEFGPGDLVVFPSGLRCTWVVSEPVRKHFIFGD